MNGYLNPLKITINTVNATIQLPWILIRSSQAAVLEGKTLLALHTGIVLPYTGNIWWGKFWQTIQVKAIGEEKFGE